MENPVELPANGGRLSRTVALTVVVLSVFMALSQVKDGNIVQAMSQAQTNALDRWNEYQATKTKLHIDETAIAQARVSAGLAAEQVRLAREIVKYRAEIPPLHGQAEGFAAQYDALNVHDDQFDACDASIGVAIAVAAVAALSENWLALFVAWVFGGFGVWMGMAGFLGLQMASPLATLLS